MGIANIFQFSWAVCRKKKVSNRWPSISRRQYRISYNHSKEWCIHKKFVHYTADALLVYFSKISNDNTQWWELPVPQKKIFLSKVTRNLMIFMKQNSVWFLRLQTPSGCLQITYSTPISINRSPCERKQFFSSAASNSCRDRYLCY